MTAKRTHWQVNALELICVISILGIVAAIAIPRFGRATEQDPDAEVSATLRMLRVAIARFHDDHGFYPGQYCGPSGPTHDVALAARQLTHPTHRDGSFPERGCPAPRAAELFGPYLRAGLPRCLLDGGQDAGLHDVSNGAGGWLYDPASGDVRINSAGIDRFGLPYRSY